MGDIEITPSSSVKILCVTVDASLTWEKRISTVLQRCYYTLIGLAGMRRRLPRDVKKLLVEALVFPYIRYCLAVWSGCTSSQLKRIQKCVNFGARTVMDLSYRDRVSEALSQLSWPRIERMITERDLCAMYRLINDANVPEGVRRLITDRSDVSCRITLATQNREIEVSRVRTEFARRSFLCRATRAWNQLPAAVKCSKSLSVFKSNVKM